MSRAGKNESKAFKEAQDALNKLEQVITRSKARVSRMTAIVEGATTRAMTQRAPAAQEQNSDENQTKTPKVQKNSTGNAGKRGESALVRKIRGRREKRAARKEDASFLETNMKEWGDPFTDHGTNFAGYWDHSPKKGSPIRTYTGENEQSDGVAAACDTSMHSPMSEPETPPGMPRLVSPELPRRSPRNKPETDTAPRTTPGRMTRSSTLTHSPLRNSENAPSQTK